MRVCIYGAGAVGGHLAGRLAKAGAAVSVVVRGAALAAIRRDGLAVDAADEAFRVAVAASDDPAELGTQDAVIVGVKAPALPQVAAGIAPLLGPETPVVFAMNGIPWWYFHAAGSAHEGRRLPLLDPGGAMWSAVGPDRAVGGVVYSACTVTAPGRVRVEGRSKFILGRPDGRACAPVDALVGLLQAGGVGAEATPRIRDAIWTKLLLNLAAGPLAVLAAGPARSALAEPACADAAARVLAEGEAIAAAFGCAAHCDPARFVAGEMGQAHKASILQDLEAGRPMEIAALYDVPLALARMAGVPTPTLDLLVGLLRARARAAGLYAPPSG